MKEQEAVVTATIKLQFRVCGDLVKALQNCWYDEADQIAKSLVEDCKDCCGLVAMICPLRMWNTDWWRNEYA